jgi:hypothetical protein
MDLAEFFFGSPFDTRIDVSVTTIAQLAERGTDPLRARRVV